MNRIRFYFKLLIWARRFSKRVKDYTIIRELRTKAHENYLEAERKENKDDLSKARIQRELLDKILSL
jgi:hypothetical protein